LALDINNFPVCIDPQIINGIIGGILTFEKAKQRPLLSLKTEARKIDKKD
jgi:hypothetical protein